MIIILILISVAYIYEIFMHEKDKKKLKEYEKRFGDV